ncbi:toxin Cry1Ac domain D-VI-related protein [Listeria booriae]|uniref:Bacterial Ig domain-containing protein n=4 Tax=Listeria booriae TaxID=1552123 RepID=A0A099WGN8_9LIST|nr:toxin Cry1Ac domain D-VI-related protein [Listeria booriae]KGL43718.1 hypothetical protein EP57_02275 [Listeria booriae]STY40660.1 ECM-binding protein homolog [Listeria booriae]
MKKQDLLKKGTSIALVATIVGSQLLATVPYNVFAAENTVGIQAVPTNSVTVSTWPELQAALTSVAVTDIYLNADITIGATTNITMTTKNIHGNNHILNANSKQLRLTTAGTVALMEDVRITNTDAYGLFWGDVNNLEVTYKNVDHSGLQMIYLPTGHLIIDGTVTSNSTTQEVYQGKDLTIKDNATAYFNAIAGIPIHLLTASGSLNVGKNATLTTRSKGISIYGAANTKLINEGNMDLKSDLNQAILLLDNSSMYFQPGSVLKAIAGDTVEEAILTVGGGIYVESGATFEVESKGTQGTINAGSTIKLAQGSNFSLTNFNPEGSVLGSYPTPANVILQSSQGVSTWDRGTVMNPKPTATYPGMFDAQFTLSGYLKGVTQTNLTSNNMQFINSYKTGATGKIVGGSFASDEQDVAKSAVDALFTDSTKTGIKTTTDQAAIDAAKDLVNKVSDPTVKADLQKDIDKAQSLLDAKNAAAAAEKAKQDAALKAVNELFNSNTPLTDAIKPTTDQAAIDAAKALVNAVTDPTVKAALQKDLNRAQELLDAKNAAAAAAEKAKQDAALKAVNELFNNNTPSTDAIKGTTDQAAINAAKALVDAVTDPTVKAALQKDLNRAQELLDAKTAAAAAEKAKQDAALKAVNELFNNNTPATDAIKGTTDQAAINAAKALVDAVIDPTVKAALQKDLNRAQELLDAKTAAAAAEKAKQDAALKAVNELFNNNTPATDAIKGTTDQAAINAAKALVDAVTDPTVKAALQKDLNRAQELLDAKNTALTKPVLDAYHITDEYVTGKVDANTATVELYINGVRSKISTPTNGEFKLYAQGFGLKVGDTFEVRPVDAKGNKGPIATGTVLGAALNLTTNDVGLSATTVTGTVGAGITSVRLSIDGTIVKVGQINADGTYSIATNNLIKPSSKVEVVGYVDKTEMVRKAVNIVNDEKPVLSALTVDDDTVKGSVTAGSAVGFRVSINGVATKTGTIAADGTFQSSIGKQPLGTVVKIEVRDSAGYNSYRTASVTVTPSAVAKLAAPTLTNMDGSYIVGTAPKGTESIVVYEDGVAVRTQNISTMTVNPDGSFTFKAYVAASASQVQVQAKNSDKRMNSDLSATFTK